MLKNIFFTIVFLSSIFSVSAHALLPAGAEAPDFSIETALAGEPASFRLSEALKKGPVVLYFYPKAFTKGCTVEAHLFAEASADFAKFNATVIGVSNDDIETLKKFSVEACRNKFAVGADPNGTVITAYDAKMIFGSSMSKRVSYVIKPDQKILFVHEGMGPKEHVSKTLEALRNQPAGR